MMDDTIAAPGVAHRAMAADLDLIADLLGGTAAMRRAGQRWLPREQAESWTAWRARLNRTVLFNGLARTVQALAGRPFAKPVTLDRADPGLEALMADINRNGTNLGGFANQLLQALLADGLTHILVDRPRGGGPPYLVHVSARQLLGAWRDDDGLIEIRILELHSRKRGQFGEESVQAVRRIDRNGWQIWQAGASGGWTVVREGKHDFGCVPLITMNAAPTGFMRTRPPLLDLAWLNLAHWQSASDQRHILHVARVPILFGRALQMAEGKVEIGPNRLILADDPAADLRFVEHSGAAIEAGRQDLHDLEERMAVLGLDMLRHRPGAETATGRAIDAAQTQAALNTITLTLENGLQQAIAMMGSWLGLPPDRHGSLNLNRRIEMHDTQTAEADLLLRARLAGEISAEAFLAEISRRGILGPQPASQTSSTPSKGQ